MLDAPSESTTASAFQKGAVCANLEGSAHGHPTCDENQIGRVRHVRGHKNRG
jgi:hypothetical protein